MDKTAITLISLTVGVISLMSLNGCSVAYEMSLSEKEKTNVVTNCQVKFEVVEFDGCQYVHGVNWFSHKGNCTNSIHIYRETK